MTRRCAVLGSPVAHSLSPALHQAAYDYLGLTDWSYERHEIDEAGLPGFVAGCDQSWRGLSLTMPLKIVAMSLGEPDPTARRVGAANTLILELGGNRVYNTDVGGLENAVRGAGRSIGEVTLLGGGGTARAVVAASAALGAEVVRVVVRTPAKAEPLRELGVRCGIALEVIAWPPEAAGAELPAADLLVSTVTAGAADPLAEAAARSAAVLFDVVYHPWPTRLAEAGLAADRTVLSGLDLLVHQAVLQIELMTGSTVPAELLLSAGQAALGASRRP